MAFLLALLRARHARVLFRCVRLLERLAQRQLLQRDLQLQQGPALRRERAHRQRHQRRLVRALRQRDQDREFRCDRRLRVVRNLSRERLSVNALRRQLRAQRVPSAAGHRVRDILHAQVRLKARGQVSVLALHDRVAHRAPADLPRVSRNVRAAEVVDVPGSRGRWGVKDRVPPAGYRKPSLGSRFMRANLPLRAGGR